MGIHFEELDYRKTRLGELSLRRRYDPVAGVDAFEIKLGDEYLMSSLFTAAETELAHLGLAGLGGFPLHAVVGGLGLGYTAAASLDHKDLGSLTVIEALAEVIDWHKRALVPAAGRLAKDPRCRFVEGDFFALAASIHGFDPVQPGRQFDAVLLDIDHSPRHFLNPGHAAFYKPEGLRNLLRHLRPAGVFAMWSNDPPDDSFQKTLGDVFFKVESHIVKFYNPYQKREAQSTVYLARQRA